MKRFVIGGDTLIDIYQIRTIWMYHLGGETFVIKTQSIGCYVEGGENLFVGTFKECESIFEKIKEVLLNEN